MADNILGSAWKEGSKAVLYAALANSLLSELVNSAEGLSLTGVAQNLVQVGGPTALGALVAYYAYPVKTNKTLTDYIYRGAIAGTTATAVLFYAGAMPVAADVQTLSFIALVGGATALGEILAVAIQ